MVSAVLVLAMFTAAFGVWTVDTVPEWIAAREHAHAGDVALSFSRMRADLDTQAADGTSASFTVDLAPDPIPLLQRSPSFGTLEMQDGAQGVSFSLDFDAGGSDREQLLAVGGLIATAPADPTTGTLPDWTKVATITALKLGADDEREIKLTATENTPSGRAVSIHLRNPLGPGTCTVTTAIEGTTVSNSQELNCAAAITINGMSDAYGFKSLLAQMDPDMTLSFSQPNGLAIGTMGIAMIDHEGVTIGFPATGSTGQSLDQSLESSGVVFIPDYLEIDDRTVRFDGGGIVNIQNDVAAFIVEPVFAISLDSTASPTQGYLRWTIVDATGVGSLTGSANAVFEFRKLSTKDLIIVVPATANDSVFTVTSPASAAWADMWQDALTLNGITSTHAEATSGSNTATLRLQNSVPWTIHLTIHDVELSVT